MAKINNKITVLRAERVPERTYYVVEADVDGVRYYSTGRNSDWCTTDGVSANNSLSNALFHATEAYLAKRFLDSSNEEKALESIALLFYGIGVNSLR